MPFVEEQTRLSIKNILLAAVFTEPSEAILSYAVSLAHRYGSGLTLTGAVVAGSIYQIIRKEQIDLVVLGANVRDSRAPGLNTAVEGVLRNVPCPTLIAGPRVTEAELANRDLERIVYVTDYTTGSLDGLPYALALAQDHDSQVNFVHVADETTIGPFHFGNSRIGAFRKQLENLISSEKVILPQSEFVVQEGDRAQGLVRIARNLHTRLIVLNARELSDKTVPYLLPAMAVQVLRLALCPVLIIRGPSSEYLRREAP